jgi:hypothetical protein
MKIKIVSITALILAFNLVGLAWSETTSEVSDDERQGRARSSSQAQTAEQLARAVADAFSDLGSLDASRPYMGTVRIRLEHSITGEFETRSFRTLAQAERWLSRGGRDPGRSSGTLRGCRRGVCTFEQEGMLHNTLYLQSVIYGMRSGRPYIRSIHIISGD